MTLRTTDRPVFCPWLCLGAWAEDKEGLLELKMTPKQGQRRAQPQASALGFPALGNLTLLL